MKNSYEFIKYLFDRVAAFAGIVLLMPLFLFAAALVASDGKGQVIFKQTRVGQKGRFFEIYKFRTMKTAKVGFRVDKAVIADNDGNVTRFGKFLRKSKIDELPQLINVLKGNMSFVGPRPLLPDYIGVYENWEYCKFKVRPGLTGLAQISGNGYLSVSERSYYDVFYVEHRSLRLDADILSDTVKAILRGEAKRQVRVQSRNIEYYREKYRECGECENYFRYAVLQSLRVSAR